jgi:hypothetical protein
MWRNLLPNGTRTVELCSAYALIIVGILSLTGFMPEIPQLYNLDSNLTWGGVLFIFGLLQLLSIFFYPQLEILRTILSWVLGCLWVWLGVATPDGILRSEDIAAVLLGIGNLYGFIINFNLIKLSWTD